MQESYVHMEDTVVYSFIVKCHQLFKYFAYYTRTESIIYFVSCTNIHIEKFIPETIENTVWQFSIIAAAGDLVLFIHCQQFKQDKFLLVTLSLSYNYNISVTTSHD